MSQTKSNTYCVIKLCNKVASSNVDDCDSSKRDSHTIAIVNLNRLPGNNIIGIRRDNVMLLICNITRSKNIENVML